MACPVIIVSPVTLPNGNIGTVYIQTFSSYGGVGPYAYSISFGSLPNGLILVGDTVTGTPITLETANFTIQSIDSNGCPGSQQYTVVISPPLIITPKKKSRGVAFKFPKTFCVPRMCYDGKGNIVRCNDSNKNNPAPCPPPEVLYPNKYGRLYVLVSSDENQCCYKLKNNG